ncbi:uncharacterized protein LOC125201605 [Salvia hispanica]|uniref:uncharacterized protein LOC125201605 n=1 Tax=Salvia hispanica TaxID=49212 RepID=UPI0020093C45|nr:uncharacterized protein LOC125201605 [Salvia hispanica]
MNIKLKSSGAGSPKIGAFTSKSQAQIAKNRALYKQPHLPSPPHKIDTPNSHKVKKYSKEGRRSKKEILRQDIGPHPRGFIKVRASMAALYEHVLYPVNGMENWSRSSEVSFELDPPNTKRQRGRPRKLRREQPQVRLHENGVESLQRTAVLSCGRCGQIGHNRRTCQNDPSVPNSQRSQASGHGSQEPNAQRERPRRPPMETAAGPGRAASSSNHVRKAQRRGRRKTAD